MENSVFYYRVGDYRILLEKDVRAELLTQDDIYPVPFSPQWCAGLLGLRGELYPVVDMHRVALNRPCDSKRRLLWLHHPSLSPVVITCDGLPAQIQLPDRSDSDLTQQSSMRLPGWVHHVHKVKKDLYLAADHARLLKNINRLVA